MNTMTQLLQMTENRHANRIAMLETGLVWADHIARLRKIAGRFGLQSGQRFAIIGPNSESQAELIHAGYLCGAVPVPVNWRLSPPEMTQVLADADPFRVFLDTAYDPLRSEPLLAPFLRDAISIGRGGFDDDLLADAIPAPDGQAGQDDMALLIYTGGTSGLPKGVCLSHGNILANAHQVAPALKFNENSRYMHIAPMFHSADLLATAVTMLGGAHLYVPGFDPDQFLDQANRHQITTTMIAPAIARVLVDHGGQELSSLKTLIYGSSPMDAGLIRAVCARFPATDILQGYGLTETAPLLSILGAAEHREIANGKDEGLAACAGKLLPGVHLRMVNADGQPVDARDPGEIEVRGLNVAQQYFRNPAETAASFRDGWFRTGDIGRLDERGYLHLMDRAKDMIITGGENVYSIQVEDRLLSHPLVAEAAVIGLPHPKWGEEVTAVLVRTSTDLDETTLATHCRDHLAGYKVPRKFFFVDTLPRNALGKVLKRRLRTELETQNG